MSRLLAALGLALVATAVAAPLPEDARRPVLYFPTTEATWVYQRFGVDDRAGHEVVEVLVRVTERDGVKRVELGSVNDGKRQSGGGTVAVTPHGLVQGYVSGTGNFVPNVTLLRLPAVAGGEWVVERPGQFDKEQRFICRGFEAVSVPAGRFDAVRVDTTFVWRDGSPPRVDRTWYAPGVGVVRWEDDEGRLKVLKRFDRGRG